MRIRASAWGFARRGF